MKTSIRLALICLSAAFFAHQSGAAEAPALAKPGKVLFEDDFARSDMAPKWRVGKGTWSIKDGVVSAAEVPEDKHGAYAYVKPNFPYKDVVVEFSVKLDGAKTCSLMINDSTYKESHAGHILRVAVSPGKVGIADWKNGAMKNDFYEKMKDPATTDDEKKKLRASIKDKSADFKVDADAAAWHVVRVEIIGDELLMLMDGKPVGYLKSAGVDHPTKNALGFEVAGKSALIKSVKIWEATPVDGWKAGREATLKALGGK